MPAITIAVTATHQEDQAKARLLADKLDIAFLPTQSLPSQSIDYLLVWTPHFLGLMPMHLKPKQPFYIDFLSGKMQYRSEQAGLRKELIARAMGVKPSDEASIIDATAGLGRDSFILARLGFNVIMLERSSILHALLNDAIERLQQHPQGEAIAKRMQLIQTDAKDWLKSEQHPDIIYLDPMFPARKKSASVKKEMAILQDLLGNDQDSEDLFNLALSCARRRVVVKRPRLATNISTLTPSFTLAGKSCRFDVYLISS